MQPKKTGAARGKQKATTPRKRRPAFQATAHRVARDDWHWFDHPEMQARIKEAEAEISEGRSEHFASLDELFENLDRLV